MTKHKHPVSKFERLRIKNKKEHEQKTIQDKAGHVRRRITVEALKAKDAEDELRDQDNL